MHSMVLAGLVGCITKRAELCPRRGRRGSPSGPSPREPPPKRYRPFRRRRPHAPARTAAGRNGAVPGVLRRTTDWAEAQPVTVTVATPVTAADTTISARVTEGRGVWTPLPVELTILDDDNMSPDVALVLTPSEVREGLVSTVTAVASGPLDDEATITVSPAPAPAPAAAGHRPRDRDLPTAPCATKRAVYPAWQRHGEARHAARRGRDGFYGRDVRHRPHARQYESDVHDVESGRGADAATHYFALKRAGRGWPGRRPVRSVAAHAAAGPSSGVAEPLAADSVESCPPTTGCSVPMRRSLPSPAAASTPGAAVARGRFGPPFGPPVGSSDPVDLSDMFAGRADGAARAAGAAIERHRPGFQPTGPWHCGDNGPDNISDSSEI